MDFVEQVINYLIMTNKNLQDFKTVASKTFTSMLQCSSATHCLVKWQDNLNISNSGFEVETGDEMDGTTVSPYVYVTHPFGDIIPKDVLPDEALALLQYNQRTQTIDKIQEGDLLMVKTQFKEDENKIEIEGEVFYSLAIEAIVGRIKDDESIETFNGFNIVQLEDNVEFRDDGFVNLKSSRYEVSSSKGTVLFGNHKGKKVAFKPSISTEHILFQVYKNTVRVHDSEILFVL